MAVLNGVSLFLLKKVNRNRIKETTGKKIFTIVLSDCQRDNYCN